MTTPPQQFGSGDGTATGSPAFPLPSSTASGPFAIPPAVLARLSTDQAQRALALSWALAAETSMGSTKLSDEGRLRIARDAQAWQAFIYNGASTGSR